MSTHGTPIAGTGQSLTGITPDWRQQLGYGQDGTSLSTRPCPYCGPATYHSGVCPKVKRIEYYPTGGIKSVELRP